MGLRESDQLLHATKTPEPSSKAGQRLSPTAAGDTCTQSLPTATPSSHPCQAHPSGSHPRLHPAGTASIPELGCPQETSSQSPSRTSRHAHALLGKRRQENTCRGGNVAAGSPRRAKPQESCTRTWCWAAAGAPVVPGRWICPISSPLPWEPPPRWQSWSPLLGQLMGSHIYSP